MPRLITLIMSHAVPGVRIESVEIVESSIRELWWFQVRPNHEVYWRCFMERYPHWKRVGFRYNLLGFRFTPMFPSRAMLIDWLSDVLGLTQGERNLLHLSTRT